MMIGIFTKDNRIIDFASNSCLDSSEISSGAALK